MPEPAVPVVVVLAVAELEVRADDAEDVGTRASPLVLEAPATDEETTAEAPVEELGTAADADPDAAAEVLFVPARVGAGVALEGSSKAPIPQGMASPLG